MFENALKYNIRKKQRTVIIFFILLIILISLNICIYLNMYLNKIDKMIYEVSNLSFSIKSINNEEMFLKDNLFKDINDVSKNYIYEALGSLENGKVYKGEGSVNIENLNPEYQNVLKLHGVNTTKYLNEFLANVYEITEGRNILENDRFKILIHEKLKEENKYKIGDKIKLKHIKPFSLEESLKNNKDENKEFEFEIIGFFKGIGEEKYTGLSSDLSENNAYVDYFSLNEFAGNKGNEKLNKISFISKSKENLDDAHKKINDLIDHKKIEIENNSDAFSEAGENISNIKSILNLMNGIIFIGGLMALSLILNLWIRDRIYEIGIMISIGRSKLDIFMQFILELLIVSIPCFVIAYILNGILNKKILFKLLNLNEMSALKNFNISNFKLSIYAYLCLLGIIIISVGISLSSIILTKPKDILKKLS